MKKSQKTTGRDPAGRQMNKGVIYKNHLIRGESFQREKDGTWIPQYTVIRQDVPMERKDYPSHQYQFNHAYCSELEADEFAVQKARDWIDKN